MGSLELVISNKKYISLNYPRSNPHLLQSWKDEYLTWNQSAYNGIASIELDVFDIWKPRLTTAKGYRKKISVLSKRRELNRRRSPQTRYISYSVLALV